MLRTAELTDSLTPFLEFAGALAGRTPTLTSLLVAWTRLLDTAAVKHAPSLYLHMFSAYVEAAVTDLKTMAGNIKSMAVVDDDSQVWCANFMSSLSVWTLMQCLSVTDHA